MASQNLSQFYISFYDIPSGEGIEKYQFELCSKYDREYGLTSYLDKSYLVASWGEYVASIQMLSQDKLKHQVRGQFLSRNIPFMSCQRLHYMDLKMVEKPAGIM